MSQVSNLICSSVKHLYLDLPFDSHVPHKGAAEGTFQLDGDTGWLCVETDCSDSQDLWGHISPSGCLFLTTVAFRIYDMDKDGYISNGELFQVLKMMVGNNLKDTQLQQIVDKTIINADKDGDGRISFEEFCAVSHFPLLLLFCKMKPEHLVWFNLMMKK